MPVKKKVAKFIAMNDFDTILERIKEEARIKSMRQLAEIIGIKHQTISAAKKKGDFSVSWAYEIEKKYGLLTGWIMTGEGPKRIDDAAKHRKLEILNELEEWLGEEMKKNPGRETWFELQMMDNFESFKKWKRKRDEAKDSGQDFPSSKVA